MMERVCPQCEAPCGDEAMVCDRCGFPLEPIQVQARRPPAPPPPPSTKSDSEIANPMVQTPPEQAFPKAKPRSHGRRPIEINALEADMPPQPAVPKEIATPSETAEESVEDSWERSFDELADHTSQIWREAEAVFSQLPVDPSPRTASPGLGKTWKLVVVEGFSAGKEYLVFKDTMVVGRRDADQGVYPDIDLEDQDDGFISRRHAVLRRHEGKLVIEDLGGENGTMVDMVAIEPHQLVTLDPGQVVRLGRVGLLVQAWEPVDGGRTS